MFEPWPPMQAVFASRLMRRSRRIRLVFAIAFALCCGLLSSHMDSVAAEQRSTPAADSPASAKLPAAKAEEDIRAARNAMAADSAAEAPVRSLIDALASAGRKGEALIEADRFVKRGSATAALRAQRGFLRRELNDPLGAAEDFSAALAGDGLMPDQRSNVEAGLAEARTAVAQANLVRAQNDLARGDYARAAEDAQSILDRNPNAEPAMFIRVEALVKAGRKPEALAEADKFLQRAAGNPLLRAQRGFLRRELNNAHGAAEDFSAALAGNGLAPDQRRNVEAGLAEARTAEAQSQLAQADAPLRGSDSIDPADERREASRRNAELDVKAGVRIAALSRAGRKREALTELNRLIARGQAKGWAYAQRGFARREAEQFQGAVQDFDAALARGDLDRRSVAKIRYARAEAAAMLAGREGSPQRAEASYRELLQTEPEQADGWFKLGYLLLQQKRRAEGAEALTKGLEIRPVATAYLDAANAHILTNAPLASKFYRQGLDRWYAGDPTLAARSEAEIERLKNEVVEADATIRTTLSYGGISSRPVAAGGTNNSFGAETRMRFDGRYLPAVQGLEATARGFSGKDSNGVRETDAGVGLRYRPITDLNLYVGGVADHFFDPSSKTEFVLNWGLGLGADAYPYSTGWKPYWDFGTFGAWRTADQRVLEDLRGNVGFLYELRAPLRGAIGPTFLAVAGYDNKATTPWASGLGPSVLAYFWLGGDKYRSYDAVLTLQLGYLFNVGSDERQRGWRGQISVTF